MGIRAIQRLIRAELGEPVRLELYRDVQVAVGDVAVPVRPHAALEVEPDVGELFPLLGVPLDPRSQVRVGRVVPVDEGHLQARLGPSVLARRPDLLPRSESGADPAQRPGKCLACSGWRAPATGLLGGPEPSGLKTQQQSLPPA